MMSNIHSGRMLSFEGDIASWSCYNDVWQNSKDKPDKFYIDLFVLANTTPGQYFSIHIEVYQRQNASNVGIPNDIQMYLQHRK